MSMLDDETVRMFVEESREHLATIENDLLAIEERGADIDDDVVNRVFRAAHSLKGGAGFLNLGKVKELAHKIENVLDMVRSRELSPNPEIVNILLISFDRLRELINNIDESNSADITSYVVPLTGLTMANLPDERKQSVSDLVDIRLPDGRTIMQVTQFDLDHARKGGNYIYLVEYDLIHDVHRIGKTPFDVLKNVMSMGTMLDSRVDVEAVGTLNDETSRKIPFYLLFATIISEDIIGGALEIDRRAVRIIAETGKETPVHNMPALAVKNDLPVAEAGQEPPDPEITQLPADRKEPPATKEAGSPAAAATSETSLRVNVHLLETLMNLAGELVLGRNQLLQAIVQNEARSINAAGQRINMVTSELQEAIMLTRMQAIGNIFNKFPRVVRDTARNVGKTIDLNIVGKEVEMDKTIIEGLNDPLTHLVRNAVDHGIETPDERVKAGKNPTGCVSMKAYHEAGQVNIEISDDGRGIDPQKIVASAVNKGQITAEQARTMSDQEKMALLFLPGVSTAEKITEISGRGVGMDVVKTNIDRLGGQVEIESEPGKGSTFRIKLPLTLAIIPCLFVSVSGVRFAIPQANVEELIRITAAQVKDRIERVGDADVLILRGNMIPIIHLANMLSIARTFVDPEMNVRKSDKREIADRRSPSTSVFEGKMETGNTTGTKISTGLERRKDDRRYRADSDLNIVVVSIGTFSYGLVVEELHDSIEIVVKPLGRHLKHLREYAGATIMGDGHVALILDVNGISSLAKLTSLAGSARAKELAEEAHRDKYQDIKSFLLFRNSPAEYCAVPLDLVERIEQVPVSSVEIVGGKRVMQYRDNSMPLFTIHEAAGNVTPLPEQESYVVIVFSISGRDLGLMGITPVDVTESKVAIDAATLRQKGIMGSAIINNHTTLIVDINELVETLKPEWFTQRKKDQPVIDAGSVILLAEDSAFFRSQVKKYLEDEGYLVAAAEDGQAAWDLLAEYGEKVRLVVTDIEMPNLDGYGLSKKIKEDERFSHLPIIAVTSLAGEEDISKGKAAGIDDYQIKLDKDKLLASIYGYLKNTDRAA